VHQDNLRQEGRCAIHSAALARQNGVVTSDGAIHNLDCLYTGQEDIDELKDRLKPALSLQE
jgi:hypothetical protein